MGRSETSWLQLEYYRVGQQFGRDIPEMGAHNFFFGNEEGFARAAMIIQEKTADRDVRRRVSEIERDEQTHSETHKESSIRNAVHAV
jgi:hypothetical protein